MLSAAPKAPVAQKPRPAPYRRGKAPAYANESEENETEKVFAPQSRSAKTATEQKVYDRRLQRVQESRGSREEGLSERRRILTAEIISAEEESKNIVKEEEAPPRGRRRVVEEPEVVVPDSERSETQEDDLNEEEIEKRRKALREKLLEKKREESEKGAEELPVEEEEEEDSEESEEEESEEEERFTLKEAPVFVRKEKRETIGEREKILEEEKKFEEEEKKRREEKKKDNLEFLKEELKKEKEKEVEKKDDKDEPLVGAELDDEDDDENEAEEYEKWKIRELQRIKRDREEKEAHQRELEDIERRRKMTDEEIQQEDKDKLQKKPKAKWNFLQRYYHKGAFYNDIDKVATADTSAPTGEDRIDKSLLPSVLQVKKFGRSGRTKYTHLVNEDTSKGALWNDWGGEVVVLKPGVETGGVGGNQRRDGFNALKQKYISMMGGMGPVDNAIKRKRKDVT